MLRDDSSAPSEVPLATLSCRGAAVRRPRGLLSLLPAGRPCEGRCPRALLKASRSSTASATSSSARQRGSSQPLPVLGDLSGGEEKADADIFWFFFLLSLESGAEVFFSNVRSEMLGGGSSFSCRVGGRKPRRTGKLHRPRRARSVRPQRQYRGHETQMPLAPRAGTRTRSRTRRLPGLERWNFPRRSVSLYFNSSLLENPFLKRSATDTLS